MIDLTGMVSIPYLKKSRFTGSYQGMRYLLEKRDEALAAVIWPEPYNFATTADDKKHENSFSFDPEGIRQAVVWLNAEYQAGNF